MKALRVVKPRRDIAELTFDTAPPLVTFAQAAKLLGCGKNSITAGVRAGNIPAVAITPTLRRIPVSALRRLAQLEEARPPE